MLLNLWGKISMVCIISIEKTFLRRENQRENKITVTMPANKERFRTIRERAGVAVTPTENSVMGPAAEGAASPATRYWAQLVLREPGSGLS